MPPSNSLDLMQGTLDMLVLKSLSWGALHGYAVAEYIRKQSDDALKIEEGALYPALHRLEKRGLLASEWGVSENNRRAKYYQLTRQGKAQLEAETRQWAAYAAAISRVLQLA